MWWALKQLFADRALTIPKSVTSAQSDILGAIMHLAKAVTFVRYLRSEFVESAYKEAPLNCVARKNSAMISKGQSTCKIYVAL